MQFFNPEHFLRRYLPAYFVCAFEEFYGNTSQS